MSTRTVGWAISLPIALVFALGGVIGLAIVRFSDVPVRPWEFIFFVLAAFGALSALLLAFIHAKEVSD